MFYVLNQYDGWQENTEELIQNSNTKNQKVFCFDKYEMEEVLYGLEDDIEPFSVNHPYFDEDQQWEISLGVEEGLDVYSYYDPAFDADQMRQIRIGLEKGLDVDWYADPCFDADQMLQIRLGLENIGIVDVSTYAKEGYTAHQMEVIRVRMELGIDITPYIRECEKNLQRVNYYSREFDHNDYLRQVFKEGMAEKVMDYINDID